jgi:hypothetical protein
MSVDAASNGSNTIRSSSSAFTSTRLLRSASSPPVAGAVAGATANGSARGPSVSDADLLLTLRSDTDPATSNGPNGSVGVPPIVVGASAAPLAPPGLATPALPVAQPPQPQSFVPPRAPTTPPLLNPSALLSAANLRPAATAAAGVNGTVEHASGASNGASSTGSAPLSNAGAPPASGAPAPRAPRRSSARGKSSRDSDPDSPPLARSNSTTPPHAASLEELTIPAGITSAADALAALPTVFTAAVMRSLGFALSVAWLLVFVTCLLMSCVVMNDRRGRSAWRSGTKSKSAVSVVSHRLTHHSVCCFDESDDCSVFLSGFVAPKMKVCYLPLFSAALFVLSADPAPRFALYVRSRLLRCYLRTCTRKSCTFSRLSRAFVSHSFLFCCVWLVRL